MEQKFTVNTKNLCKEIAVKAVLYYIAIAVEQSKRRSLIVTPYFYKHLIVAHNLPIHHSCGIYLQCCCNWLCSIYGAAHKSKQDGGIVI